ncbi:MAG: ferredoxin [Desulfococcaceae bacterium]
MSRKVVIETEKCIGCQSCAELCPDIFGFDEDAEKAKVIMESGWAEDCIQEAMDACPAECIYREE